VAVEEQLEALLKAEEGSAETHSLYLELSNKQLLLRQDLIILEETSSLNIEVLGYNML